ncbi:MAG: hypothetical protein QOD74_478 [Variibacter sp.]|jgi:AcrR family transcriptional regulator|nr:hypothetical protein [Variibacter sp.]
MRQRTEAIRARIIDAAYEAFWRQGFRRASLDVVAARASVTKRTIYGYFRSKDDLLAGVLSRHAELAAKRLAHIAERMPKERKRMVGSIFRQLAGWSSRSSRWSGSGFTRLVVELSDLPGHPAHALARKAKARTEAWLAEHLARDHVRSPKRRAREVMLLIEGAMALTLIHGGCAYIDAAGYAAKRIVAK